MAAFLAFAVGALWTGSAALLLLQALRWQASLKALRRQPCGVAHPRAPADSPAGDWEVVVLVAARNEAHHLPHLHGALEAQLLPQARLSWWLVDDGSTDGGVAALSLPQARTLEPRVLRQEAKGKLAALSLGMESLLLERPMRDRTVLLFTDADCQPGPHWAAMHLKAHQQGAQVVAGHVRISVGSTRGPQPAPLLRRFENAVSSLQVALGCAVGRPPFTRGANWSVRLDLLERAGALRGLEQVPSGDDVHGVRRLASHEARFHFLLEKEACVATVEEASRATAQARRRYGKLRELPLPERLRQGALFSALAVQLVLLGTGFLLPGGLWRGPLVTVLVVGAMAHRVLFIGLRLLGEGELAAPALPLALRLVLHALWHSLRGTLGGYGWKDAGPAPAGRDNPA